MLTFFDYLRQRAYESIVAGVEDALGSLESESYTTQLNQAVSEPHITETPNLEPQPATPREQKSDEGQLAAPAAESTELPRPRRRGRPRKPRRPS